MKLRVFQELKKQVLMVFENESSKMDGEWRQYVGRNAPHNGDRAQWQH